METRYKILESMAEARQLIKSCKKMGYCCNDFETNAVPIYMNGFRPTLLAISFMPGFGVALPLYHFQAEDYYKEKGITNFGLNKRLKAARKIGRELIENPKVTKVAWNFKFDGQIWEHFFKKFYRGVLLDGMIMKYVLNEERPHDLKSMVRRYLPDMGDYEKADKFDKIPWDKKELLPLAFYACQDSDYTLRLALFFEKKLIDLNLYSVYRNLFITGSRVLTSVEKCGLYVDRKFNEELLVSYKDKINAARNAVMDLKKVQKFSKQFIQERIDKYVASIEAELEDLDYNNPKDARKISSRETKISNIRAGIFTTKTEQALIEPINLGSNPTLIALMYEHPKGFKFPVVKYTQDAHGKETNKPSTDEESLTKLRVQIEDAESPKAIFLDKLLELRGLEKMYKTYILGWNEKTQDDSRLHGRINICGTDSNRYSCIDGDSIILTNKGNYSVKEVFYLTNSEHESLQVMTRNGWEYIQALIIKGEAPMYKVTLEDGSSITCTLEHKFITHQGVVKLKDIHNGSNKLLRYIEPNFKEVSIKSVEPVGIRMVYDFTIHNTHEYVANGILNHNSAEPNLQQIPKTSVDPNIKKQLVAPKGKLYLAYDYSQAELRMMAHLSGDETYLKAFRDGVDPHLAIAINKYNADPEEAIKAYGDEQHPDYKLWKNRRKQAKQIAFGLIYGIGPGLLAEKLSDPKAGLKVEKEEAKQIMDEFFKEHPKIKKFKDRQEKFIKKHGYYKQLFGTKRRLPEIWRNDKEKQAYAIRLGLNFPCQGAAANMTNFGSVLIYWLMRQGKLPRMEECCTVHDSVYQYTDPKYINIWTVFTIWDILRNPSTKSYFGFQIDDVDLSMDFSIGRTMAEELPFIPFYDYNKMLDPNFSVDEYMEEHRKWKNIEIKDYPKVFKKEMKQYEQEFLREHST